MIDKENSYQMFNSIASTYDRINQILSLGVERYWKGALIKEGLKRNPQSILDVATGTGSILFHFLKKAPTLQYTGIDRSIEMLKLAQNKHQHVLEANLRFDEGDGEHLPYADHQFDLTTVSFGIRNMPHPEKCLREIHRVLKRAGRCLVLEFSLPRLSLVKQCYLFYLRHVLPKIGKLLSSHHEAYSYLNQTIETFPFGKDFEDLMRQEGFKDVSSKTLSFGIVTLYVGTKK